MRPCPVVPLHEIAPDILLGQRCRHVTHRRYPFRFQAPKQPLRGRVVIAVPPSAHVLSCPVAPQPLAEATAGIRKNLPCFSVPDSEVEARCTEKMREAGVKVRITVNPGMFRR